MAAASRRLTGFSAASRAAVIPRVVAAASLSLLSTPVTTIQPRYRCPPSFVCRHHLTIVATVVVPLVATTLATALATTTLAAALVSPHHRRLRQRPLGLAADGRCLHHHWHCSIANAQPSRIVAFASALATSSLATAALATLSPPLSLAHRPLAIVTSSPARSTLVASPPPRAVSPTIGSPPRRSTRCSPRPCRPADVVGCAEALRRRWWPSSLPV